MEILTNNTICAYTDYIAIKGYTIDSNGIGMPGSNDILKSHDRKNKFKKTKWQAEIMRTNIIEEDLNKYEQQLKSKDNNDREGQSNIVDAAKNLNGLCKLKKKKKKDT